MPQVSPIDPEKKLKVESAQCGKCGAIIMPSANIDADVISRLVRAVEAWRVARDENPRRADYLGNLYVAEDELRSVLEEVGK